MAEFDARRLAKAEKKRAKLLRQWNKTAARVAAQLGVEAPVVAASTRD